jgi:hypothetical protein
VINQEHFDFVLDHLVRLAKQPGWKQYAWHAAKQYEEINPYDLAGMQEKLKQRMQQEKEQQQ